MFPNIQYYSDGLFYLSKAYIEYMLGGGPIYESGR